MSPWTCPNDFAGHKCVSEVMKTRPAEAVVAWLNGQDSQKLYVSDITIGKIA